MKKFIISAVVLLSAAICLSAQEKAEKENSIAKDVVVAVSRAYDIKGGWFTSVGGGFQIYGGDHNRQLKIGNLISPAADVSVGKWFNPFVAARVSYNGLQANGATHPHDPTNPRGGASYIRQDENGKPMSALPYLKKNYDSGAQVLYLQRFNFMNIHADVMVNLSNLLGNAIMVNHHLWNASPYVGIGFPYVLTDGNSDGLPISVNAGLYNAFAINDKIDAVVDLRGAMLDDEFDGEPGGRKLEGVVGATFGISYKF